MGATVSSGLWAPDKHVSGYRSIEEQNKHVRALIERKEWDTLTKMLSHYPPAASQVEASTGRLPLQRAIMKRASLELIEKLLELHPEGQNHADDDGMKCLHYASIYLVKELELYERILKAYPAVVKEPDNEGRLPIHLAAASRPPVEIVNMLVHASGDAASRRTKSGRLPLHFAAEHRAPTESLRALLEAFPAGVREHSNMHNPLMFACQHKAPPETVQILLQAFPEGAAEKGSDGLTPLHFAAANRAAPEVIQMLLDVNQEMARERDRMARMPLHHALEKGTSDEAVLLLLKAAPETAAIQGYSPNFPLHIAVEKGAGLPVISELLRLFPRAASEKDMHTVYPLRRALKSRAQPEVVLAILAAYPDGAAEFDEYERLALHYAVARKMPIQVIDALLKACPSAAAVQDKNGQLPLHLSVMRLADLDVTTLILSAFPEGVLVADNYGYMPLHHAIEMDATLETIQLLLKTDPKCSEHRIKSGKLPLHFAVETKRSCEVIEAIYLAYPDAIRDKEPEKGRLPLHWALERHSELSVLLLLEAAYAGDCSFVADNDGRLPIYYAILYHAPVEIVRILLAANPHVVDVVDSPAFFLATDANPASTTKPRQPRKRKRLLHFAAEDAHAPAKTVAELMALTLPISPSTGEPNLNHGFGWTFLLSETDDEYLEAVELILDLFQGNITWLQRLCDTTDEVGRLARDIATPKCRQALGTRLHFFGRYQLQPGPPAHISSNSIVRFAVDHHQIDESRGFVALKFMRHREQFDREVGLRSSLHFDSEFVVPLICSHDGDADPRYREETLRKGLEDYPYCLVLVAAERDLMSVITHEHIAALDTVRIRSTAASILRSIAHLHDVHGIIHGDIKPLNIVRHGGSFKFIDLGASVHKGQMAGTAKVSTAYLPPELIFRPVAAYPADGSRDLSMKTGLALSSHVKATDKVRLETLPAAFSMDMWAFGMIFYMLCVGKSMFHQNLQDDIDRVQQDAVLALWSEAFKSEKLAAISDPLARNLLFQLLSKDPRRRPSASSALEHRYFDAPFDSTGVAGTASEAERPFRFEGMAAKYDVCICYRRSTRAPKEPDELEQAGGMNTVESKTNDWVAEGGGEDRSGNDDNEEETLSLEHSHALQLEVRLKAAGFSVCLSSLGEIDGLLLSRTAVFMFSRASVNNSEVPAFNLGALDAHSEEDTFFLQMRFAVEILEHGLLEGGIIPWFVGDLVAEEAQAAVMAAQVDLNGDMLATVAESYQPYFAQADGVMLGKYGGCHPLVLSTSPVDTVERSLRRALRSYTLGTPILRRENASVSSVVQAIISGHIEIYVLGDRDSAVDLAATNLIDRLSSPMATATTLDAESIDPNTSLNGAGDRSFGSEAKKQDVMIDEGDSGEARRAAELQRLQEALELKKKEVELLEKEVIFARQLLGKKAEEIHLMRKVYSIL